MSEPDRQSCSVCGAHVKPREITYVQTIGNAVYIVRDVPADVCVRCGEEYLSPEIVDEIQAMIEQQRTAETLSVPVYRFHRAAS